MTDRQLITVPASRMTMRAAKWLYDQRIPAGTITLLAGREGIGKSTISYDVAARLTRGTLPGKYQGIPTDVAVVATEDAWEEVIVPRLVVAGADLDRVHRLEAQDEEGRRDIISVPADLTALAGLSTELGIVLLLLDPLMSVIHGSLDTHKDREVRRALDPLARFASETGVSVLGLIHVNKSNGTDPMSLVMGSRAFTAVARSVLYCLTDPQAEREDRFLFGHVKSNLGPKQQTLVYGIDQVKIDLDDQDGTVILTSRVRWDGVDERSIREAMETPGPERVLGEVATNIAVWIAEQGHTVALADIQAAFPDIQPATVRQNLTRMVERGTIRRPVQGHYVTAAVMEKQEAQFAQAAEAAVTRVPAPVTASQPSQPSPDLAGVTPVTDVTGKRTSQEPSQRRPARRKRPQRIQLRRTKGWRRPPDVVNVARPSRWGSPYNVSVYGLDESLRLYRDHLRAHPSLVEQARAELAGRDLACWCELGVRCHADILLAVVAGDEP